MRIFWVTDDYDDDDDGRQPYRPTGGIQQVTNWTEEDAGVSTHLPDTAECRLCRSCRVPAGVKLWGTGLVVLRCHRRRSVITARETGR